MLPINIVACLLTGVTLFHAYESFGNLTDLIERTSDVEKAGLVLLVCAFIASAAQIARDLHYLLGLKGWMVAITVCAILGGFAILGNASLRRGTTDLEHQHRHEESELPTPLDDKNKTGSVPQKSDPAPATRPAAKGKARKRHGGKFIPTPNLAERCPK